MISVKINTAGLKRKQRKLRGALVRADGKAQRDAARQTRTQASKMVREKLNLNKKQADKGLLARRRSVGAWEFRARYSRTPAHRFGGYRPNGQTAAGRTRYLRVRFHRGQPALSFRRGFTIERGGTQIAITRTGRTRYPIVGITGPSAHGELEDRKPELTRHGRAAYVRRSNFWKDRELRRVG